ncbi:fimbrial protein [Burkholderia pseudomultivorans]|uniref:fimbrial protein n=1 Tax=Burkholderia pseudomultivorans TaxID=1207504 RepID=UPI00189084ED|nr:fimbrial protein [Burkholderia pseudomultivorans]MBF5008782.1 type 1 fimbrial protein [Burkholderia pseudomultivorans]
MISWRVAKELFLSRAKFNKFAACLVFLIASPYVMADCRIDDSKNESIKFVVQDYMRDSVIGKATTQYARPVWGRLNCDSSYYSTSSTAEVIDGELVPGYSNVYKTGVDGIGIRFFGVAYGMKNTQQAPFTYIVPSDGGTTQFNSAAQLIVTGQVRGGVITKLPQMRVRYWTRDTSSANATTYTLSISVPITIVSKGCTVTNSSIAAKLPQILKDDLGPLGSTAGETNFAINLTGCPSGAKIYATLTDASDPANVSNVLSLSPGSTAQGVGYQLSFKGNVVNFGPDSAAPGTLNQFPVDLAPGTMVTVPMSVKYVKTSEKITPGSANGLAIFNMSYQ